MHNVNYLTMIRHQYKLVAAVVVAVVFVGLLVTVFQPFQYRASVQVLVIEQANGVDAYSAIRSAEKINTNLSHIVYTSSFREKALSSALSSNTVLPTDPIKRQKAWAKSVKAQTISETGILKVDVYRADRQEAMALAGAVAAVLSTSGAEYLGSGSVLIKIVDQPVSPNYPVKPNVVLNLAASIALGLLLSIGYILLTAHEQEEAQSRDRLDSELAAVDYPVVAPVTTDAVVLPGIVTDQPSRPDVVPVRHSTVAPTKQALVAAESSDDEPTDAFYKMLFPDKQ
ncbi:hypothetical protein HY933_03735 [Candidatus Falkowbacteria bacterium]|nr:hypothetical protein [Candidatus Falkowbacteria bacterium]